MTSQKRSVRFDDCIQRQLDVNEESRYTAPPQKRTRQKIKQSKHKCTNDKVYWRGGRPRRLPGATVTGCVIST